MPQYSDEPNSSMKHYFYSNLKRDTGDNVVKIFAPFDGYVTNILSAGITEVPASSLLPWWPFNQWRFNVGVAHPLPEMNGPAVRVKSGQIIGYANAKFHGPLPSGSEQAYFVLDLIAGIGAFPPQFKKIPENQD